MNRASHYLRYHATKREWLRLVECADVLDAQSERIKELEKENEMMSTAMRTAVLQLIRQEGWYAAKKTLRTALASLVDIEETA